MYMYICICIYIYIYIYIFRGLVSVVSQTFAQPHAQAFYYRIGYVLYSIGWSHRPALIIGPARIPCWPWPTLRVASPLVLQKINQAPFSGALGGFIILNKHKQIAMGMRAHFRELRLLTYLNLVLYCYPMCMCFQIVWHYHQRLSMQQKTGHPCRWSLPPKRYTLPIHLQP